MSLTVAMGAPTTAEADLSRLVVVGDSLSAGYQNGSLLASQQASGYAARIAAQAGVGLALPLIAEPGIPNVLTLVDPGPPPIVAPAPGVSTGRLDPSVVATNVAVPGATVHDALARRPDFPIDSLTDLVLGLPGLFLGVSQSQVEWAEALAPTTVVVWLGANDALAAVIAADPALVTPLADFTAAYRAALARLAATGARLVVANLPDITVIPFLTPAGSVGAMVEAQTGVPAWIVLSLLGLEAGDFVTPDAFALVPAILGNPGAGPLPGSVVLTADEAATIQSAVTDFNAVIADAAAAHGAAFVDIRALLAGAAQDGIVVGGQRLTTGYLGGFFSLDGIHPTDTGYAIVANAFIHALNTTFGTDVPRVNVRDVQRDDALVLPGVGHPAASLAHPSPATAAALRAVLGR
ncbi:MAG: hypothetical protein HYR51_09130 [Candidatus Rokubacteria bacterium]|nr:hypothetical protein [Candidatus Rokubacteria bacterium]